MRQKSAKKGTVIKTLTLLIFLFFVIFAFFYLLIFMRCFGAAEKVPNVEPFSMIRMEVYGSSLDTVSARFALLDTSGKEFAVLDRSWNGNALFVEFTSATFGGRRFLFPLRIRSELYLQFGRTQKYPGAELDRYYLFDGECAFFDSSFSRQTRKSLYSLAFFAIWQASKFRSQYSSVYTINLSSLERGRTYEIVVDFSNGNLSLLKF